MTNKTKPDDYDLFSKSDLGANDDEDEVESDDIEDDQSDDTAEDVEDAPASEKDDKDEEDDRKTVPLAVLLEERGRNNEKIERMEKELEKLREPEPKKDPAPKKDPYDVFAEPEKLGEYVQTIVGPALTNQRLNISEEMARDKFGDEVVDKAVAALKEHGSEAEKAAVIGDRNPYKALVAWDKERSAKAELGGRSLADIEAEIRKKIMKELGKDDEEEDDPPNAPPPSLAGRRNDDRNRNREDENRLLSTEELLGHKDD